MNGINDVLERLTDRYSRAPVSNPLLGQQTLYCHDCGSYVLNSTIHDAHHKIFEAMQRALLALELEPAEPEVVVVAVEEVTTSEPTPTPRAPGKKTTGS